MAKGGVLIGVEWGYELHELVLSPEDWSRVRAGQPLSVEGDGYGYEGEFFQDVWAFEGGLEGQLTVTYGEGDDEGVGWEGTLSDADIEEGWNGDTDEAANAQEPSPASG